MDDASSPKIIESLSMSMTCSMMSESSGSTDGVSLQPAIWTSTGFMKSEFRLKLPMPSVLSTRPPINGLE